MADIKHNLNEARNKAEKRKTKSLLLHMDRKLFQDSFVIRYAKTQKQLNELMRRRLAMGAEQFTCTSIGKSAGDAFSRAVERASYERGHGGYTGTIAEKDSFVSIPVPKAQDPGAFALNMLKDGDPRIDDKWGPAGCVKLKTSEEDRAKYGLKDGESRYFFFGWASS